MAPAAIVAIAASAGGLNAISKVLAGLPGDFPVPVAVVQHLDPKHRSVLSDILSRRTALRVREAADGEALQAGHVYVAPPDRHLLVNADGTISLTRTQLVHFVRPSADLLFESVAASYRERAIAVVLSGSGSDGDMGAQAIRKTGGTLIVQDPASAEYGGMPQAALPSASSVLALEEIAPALVRLAGAARSA